jgi:hypothetical protein
VHRLLDRGLAAVVARSSRLAAAVIRPISGSEVPGMVRSCSSRLWSCSVGSSERPPIWGTQASAAMASTPAIAQARRGQAIEPASLRSKKLFTTRPNDPSRRALSPRSSRTVSAGVRVNATSIDASSARA